MLKRFALMVAASAVLVVPASSAFASQPPKTHGLPEEACFAVYPAPLQPILCGQGTGGPGPGEALGRWGSRRASLTLPGGPEPLGGGRASGLFGSSGLGDGLGAPGRGVGWCGRRPALWL